MSDIKDCFCSRFNGGMIVEIDYSQLEIIGLAVLSGDNVLKNDIRAGLDLHCVNTASLYIAPYELVHEAYLLGDKIWTDRRKLVKRLSFQLQYGSGATAMAKSNGCTKKVAENFIKSYYNRYPRVKEWQEENIRRVNVCKKQTNEKSAKGYPICKAELYSPTGRVYHFKEYDSPEYLAEKGIKTSFSPTMIKNYPVQGFSTGDLVPLALGKLMRYLLDASLTDVILLVNTIHDSVILDVDANFGDCHLDIGNLLDVMESIVPNINNLWPDVCFDLPLKADASVGSNWGNMKPFKR